MTSRRLKARDSLWLFLALLLHLAFLLVPPGKPLNPVTTPPSISVLLDIQTISQPDSESPVAEQDLPEDSAQSQPPDTTQPVAQNQQVTSQSTTPSPSEDQQVISKLTSDESSPTNVTTAQLLLSVSELEFAPQSTEPKRQLGDTESVPLPANWSAGLKLEENLFDDKMVSGKAEVVDQWSSADGSFNMIVKAPNGKTFCGHAQPRNRISSMEARVVMWKSCD